MLCLLLFFSLYKRSGLLILDLLDFITYYAGIWQKTFFFCFLSFFLKLSNIYKITSLGLKLDYLCLLSSSFDLKIFVYLKTICLTVENKIATLNNSADKIIMHMSMKM